MKIRAGFVSNSSSTSHIIQWRGDLRAVLEAHRNIFPTEFDADYWGSDRPGYVTTVDEIIDAIVSRVGLHTADEHDQYCWGGGVEGECDDSTLPSQRGPNADGWNSLVVDFGDNDGDFSGSAIGMVMDYEGRMISVNDETLRYHTEQNR